MMSKYLDVQSLPEAARHFPFSLILGGMRASAQPGEAQKRAFRQAAQRTDVIADNLVRSFRGNSAEGRRQFDAALEHGIAQVGDVSEELGAFFAAMDDTPYWVDPGKVRRAQEVISGFSVSTIVPMMAAFGLPASYIASRVNQTLIRSGDLETKAGGRFIETVTWLMRCTTPGGLERFAPGFKSTAQVRLIHGYVRAGLNRLPDWDYEQWDRPVNQAQQSLTMLPFILGTLLCLPLGNPASLRDVDAILHFYRYLSHLVGIEPELQITDLQEVRKMLWLTAWAELQPDEWTPLLNQALQDALPAIYGVPTGSLKARLLKQYHGDLARLTLGKHYCDALGFRPLSPMIAAVMGVSAFNFVTNLAARLIPGGRRRVLAWRLRWKSRFLDAAASRVAADLSFNRANARVHQGSLARRPVSIA